MDWIRGELNGEAHLDLVKAGIKLPTGRLMGEEKLNEAYPWLLRPSLLSIKVDSGSTVGTLADRGDLSLEELDTVSLDARKIPPTISADLTRMTGRYTVSIGKLSSLLTRHSSTAEPWRPLIPARTADYTGIIIIADRELPVHGRNTQTLAEPCLFPKIWDTDMNLIYERNMFQSKERRMVSYTVLDTIFRPTPSGLEGDLAALAGPNPLRIIARGIFGISPTDPVIDREDALKILSSDNNRRLLREGRVILVLNGKMLKTSF